MAAKTMRKWGALGTTSAHVSATVARVSTAVGYVSATAERVVAAAGRKLRVKAHSKTRRKLQTLTVAVFALALLAGCGPSQPRVAVAPTATYKAEVVRDMPTTPAGVAASWLLYSISNSKSITQAQIRSHFSQSLLKQTPSSNLYNSLTKLRAAGPYTMLGYEDSGNRLLIGVQDSNGRQISIDLVADSRSQIVSLTFGHLGRVPVITDEASLARALNEVGDDGSSVRRAASASQPRYQSSFLVARIDTLNGCGSPLTLSNADDQMPIGRLVDLYTLAGVAEAVIDGGVEINQDATVLPSMIAQGYGRNDATMIGKKYPLRVVASHTIHESDPTSATMLMKTVGADGIRAAAQNTGKQDLTSFSPLLTPRALGQIAWSDSDLRFYWREANKQPEQQRQALHTALVNSLSRGSVAMDPNRYQDVLWPEGIGWFASAREICRAQSYLGQLSQRDVNTDALLRNAMVVENGVHIDSSQWTYATYVGAESPGQLAMTWVLTSPEGARYCLVMILAARDNTTLPSPLWLQAVARQVIDRLPIWIAAKEPKASATATATATNPTAKATKGKASKSKATKGSRRASQSPAPATPAPSSASTARPDKATSSPR